VYCFGRSVKPCSLAQLRTGPTSDSVSLPPASPARRRAQEFE